MERENKKQDMRVIKSQRELKSSLVKLLQSNSFDTISVIDICNEAKVNRMTFYNHYKDKYDLFYSLIESTKKKFFNEYEAKTKSISFRENPNKCLYILLEIIVDQALKYENIISNLTLNQNNGIASYMFKNACDSTINAILTNINVLNNNSLNFPIDLVTSFMSGGVTSIILYWLDNKNSISKDEFLKTLYKAIDLTIQSNILFTK